MANVEGLPVAGSVAELAADPAWRATLLVGGGWSTVERSFQHAGQQWVIGLTPVDAGVALIVWCDEQVVGHSRGDEAAMCAVALEWVSRILGDAVPNSR